MREVSVSIFQSANDRVKKFTQSDAEHSNMLGDLWGKKWE